MTPQRLARLALAAQRIEEPRFPDKAAREALLIEEREALRVAILSTCQRDRSAAQAVADAFHLSLSEVYRWPAGEVEGHPLRRLCELLDACVAAKGEDSEAALEPARLIWRRYLAPAIAPGPASEHHGLHWMREAVEALESYTCLMQDGPSPEQARRALRELDDLDRASAQARGVILAVLGGGGR